MFFSDVRKMYLYRGPEKFILNPDNTINPDDGPAKSIFQEVRFTPFTSRLFDDPSEELDPLKRLFRERFTAEDLEVASNPFLIYHLVRVDISTTGELEVRIIKHVIMHPDLIDEVKQMGYVPLNQIDFYGNPSGFIISDRIIEPGIVATSMKLIEMAEREIRSCVLVTTRDHRLHLIKFHITENSNIEVRQRDITEIFKPYKIVRIEAPDSELIVLLTDSDTIVTGVVEGVNTQDQYFLNQEELNSFPSIKFEGFTFYDTRSLYSIRRIISDGSRVFTALRFDGQVIVAGGDSSMSGDLPEVPEDLKPVDFGTTPGDHILMKGEDDLFYLYDIDEFLLSDALNIATDLTFDPFQRLRMTKSARY